MQPIKLIISNQSRPLWAITDKGQTLFRKHTALGMQFMTWTKKKDAQAIITAIETHGLEYVENQLDRKAYLESESQP